VTVRPSADMRPGRSPNRSRRHQPRRPRHEAGFLGQSQLGRPKMNWTNAQLDEWDPLTLRTAGQRQRHPPTPLARLDDRHDAAFICEPPAYACTASNRKGNDKGPSRCRDVDCMPT
jgi:hypothetical protein